ncbi:MAG: hypothetical protein AABZ40_03775 [Thermodesulfobacteriota bacterium]
MDKITKEYLDRASEIIGERTKSEIFHDDAVVEALIQGRTIKEALSIAGTKYPNEAIKWDDSNIGDIEAHYDYLKEHANILKSLKKQKKI